MAATSEAPDVHMMLLAAVLAEVLLPAVGARPPEAAPSAAPCAMP